MSRILIALLFFLNLSIGFAQKKKTYYAGISNHKSKVTQETILAVTDTSITTFRKGKTRVWHTSEINKIKIYRSKKFPLIAVPVYVGLGYFLSSPFFKSDFGEVAEAAGFGAGIILANGIAEVAFRKTYEKINVSRERHLKEKLAKYIYTKSDTLQNIIH